MQNLDASSDGSYYACWRRVCRALDDSAAVSVMLKIGARLPDELIEEARMLRLLIFLSILLKLRYT